MINNSEPEVEDSHMYFSDQGIMGFRSQANMPGAQGEMNVEKQTDFPVQENVHDRKAFLKFLSQAAEPEKISGPSANKQEGAPTQEEQIREIFLNFLRSELNPDNTDDSLEISTEENIPQLIDSAGNIPCCTDIPELNLMIPGQPEELKYVDEKSDIDPFLLQAFNFITENEVPDHLEVASGADLKLEALENQATDLPDTGKDGMQELRTFLEQVLLASKNADDALSPEVNSANVPLVKAFEGQAPGKHLTEEPRTDADLRQLVGFFTNESKHKPVVENEMFDAALKVFAEQDEKIQNGGNVFKNITVNNLDGNLQALKESGNIISNPPVQTVSAVEHQDITTNLNSQIKQVAMVFGKDSYRVESAVLGQVVVRLFTGVRQGSQNMTIYLYPPELGKVKVRIVSDKGDLHVRMHSMNHHVAGILEKYLPILQQSLADQGIVLSDLQVTVESGDQERSRSDEQGFWSGGRELTSPELSEKNQDTVIVGKNPGWSGPSQGLSLRV
jgi:flagellar hook-length control protein FliK